MSLTFLCSCSRSAGEDGLYCAERFAVVAEEGSARGLFVPEQPGSPPAAAAVGDDDEREEVNPAACFATAQAEDILLVRNQGLDVNDDNEPAPENVPTADGPETEDDGLYPGQRWG